MEMEVPSVDELKKEYSVEDLRLELDDGREEPRKEELSKEGLNKEELRKEELEDEDEADVPLKSESVKIDIMTEGDDSATLPLKKKKDKDPQKKNPSMYLFPITRMKLAWTSSANICEFLLKATLIIFSTLGWMFCVGGVPFVSLALLIIGSIYVDDCKIQPNIPVYLIVAGVLGTIQHFMAIWTKYVPKDSQGRLKEYRSYCKVIDCFIQLFLTIWFVLGCIWVYGVYGEVEYKDTFKNEYCNKTLYLFAFWILNFSFMILALLAIITFTCIVCIMLSSKDGN